MFVTLGDTEIPKGEIKKAKRKLDNRGPDDWRVTQSRHRVGRAVRIHQGRGKKEKKKNNERPEEEETADRLSAFHDPLTPRVTERSS